MIARFEGTPPEDDEAAAILAVLSRDAKPPGAAKSPTAWSVAARFPDFSIDQLRAFLRSSRVW